MRAHTLRVETGCWQTHNSLRLRDKGDLHDVQEETFASKFESMSFFVPLIINVLRTS